MDLLKKGSLLTFLSGGARDGYRDALLKIWWCCYGCACLRTDSCGRVSLPDGRLQSLIERLKETASPSSEGD